MAKKASAKTAVGDEADPRFEPVAKAFARTPGFSLMESKSRATRGLMLNGKSFGMSSHGRLILKMNEARVATLISKGIARPKEHWNIRGCRTLFKAGEPSLIAVSVTSIARARE